ncbi:MAG: hypothetical protein HYZ81_13770 [Nitrospinae bacterium]|nr:hypothetical protein [Nitrospinota bacterium]
MRMRLLDFLFELSFLTNEFPLSQHQGFCGLFGFREIPQWFTQNKVRAFALGTDLEGPEVATYHDYDRR